MKSAMNAVLLGSMSIFFCTLTALAQEAASYPAKTVRIVVPYNAGGQSDTLARVIGQKLSEKWGQTVVIDNRAGAGGNIGTEFVARAAPDG